MRGFNFLRVIFKILRLRDVHDAENFNFLRWRIVPDAEILIIIAEEMFVMRRVNFIRRSDSGYLISFAGEMFVMREI